MMTAGSVAAWMFSKVFFPPLNGKYAVDSQQGARLGPFLHLALLEMWMKVYLLLCGELPGDLAPHGCLCSGAASDLELLH